MGEGPKSEDPRIRAGQEAEKQLAYYLDRAFGNDPKVFVLHDLRLVDDEGLLGEPRRLASQIDHLVLHGGGAFVIESKSCVTGVRVRSDGDGRDEWERCVGKGQYEGMPSPLQQARRQADHLRKILNHHREDLRRHVGGLLGLVLRLQNGTPQQGFLGMPIQRVVAIGDRGRLERSGWKLPEGEFAERVLKADHVVDFVREEMRRHAAGRRLLGSRGDYGLWWAHPDELKHIAAFLRDRARPRVTATSAAACKGCAGTRLEGRWGRYGYYWRCLDCDTNTSMPRTCTHCGSKNAKVHKDGPVYERRCPDCATRELVWRIP